MSTKTRWQSFFKVDSKVQQEEHSRPKTKKLFKKIYGGTKIPWLQMILGWIIVIVAVALAALQTETLAQFSAGNISDLGQVISYALMALLCSTITVLSVSAPLGEVRVATNVRKKLWNKIMRLPVSYFDKESPNRIISRVTIDAASAAIPFEVMRGSLILLAVALTMMLMSSCNKTMLLVMLVGALIVMVLMFLTYRLMIFAGFISANRLSVFTSFLSERLANIKLIKASKAEKAETRKGEEIIEMRYKAGIFNVAASTIVSMASSVNVAAMYVACFLVGAVLIQNGTIVNGADLNAAYLYGGYITLMFAYIAQIPTRIGVAAGSMQGFAAIYDEKDEDVTSGSLMPENTGDISMEQVGFSYENGRQVLNAVSCGIPQGKVTAIVGPNGAGKSTLIKLVDRLYTDYSGNLYVGETRAENISLHAWRDQFAIVSQNASLFSGSIKDNICYGLDRAASLEEISHIAHLANLDELIAKHEEGLDFDIGIGGSRLSGSEQQRLAIARAMMKDPKYLILDEATANLDAKTESQVKESISMLMKGRTVITIAHNFSAIEQADHILVINNGSIEGAGTHQELLETCEFYKKLAGAGFEV